MTITEEDVIRIQEILESRYQFSNIFSSNSEIHMRLVRTPPIEENELPSGNDIFVTIEPPNEANNMNCILSWSEE